MGQQCRIDMRSAMSASLGKWLPRRTPGQPRWDGAEQAAIILRRLRLGIKRLVLRRATVEEQQDDRRIRHRSRRPLRRLSAGLQLGCGNVSPPNASAPTCMNCRRVLPSHLAFRPLGSTKFSMSFPPYRTMQIA